MTFSLSKAVKKAPDTFVQAISDSIPRDTFGRLIQNFDLCGYEQLIGKTNSRSSAP